MIGEESLSNLSCEEHMRKYLGVIIVVVAALFVTSLYSCTAKAAETVHQQQVMKCTAKALFTAYGWSALYGGGLMGAVAFSTGGPIGTSVMVGAAIGVGSSAVTRMSDIIGFKTDPLMAACVLEIEQKKTYLESLKDKIFS
jgi:hypothetical protein